MQFAIGRNWMSYFDLVVTEANKEVFFDEFNDTFFSELDVEHTANGDTGDRRVKKHVVGMLNRQKVYAHGNVKPCTTRNALKTGKLFLELFNCMGKL
ncbi:5'-nucleotidase activity protein [Phytophthora oleae]|uniref:5'-nucleotidase activity protein n=1 Tax=Phytophthora oleae TaxID=2107226 RepID=A0ABD3G404_9STRA